MQIYGKDELLNSFLEEPTKENFIEILNNNLGESNNIEFKKTWIAIDKIVQIILGMANSGGGCIIFGVDEKNVKDSFGLDDIMDPADFNNKISKFIPNIILSRAYLKTRSCTKAHNLV